MSSKLAGNMVEEAGVSSLILSRFLPYQLNNIAKRVSHACSHIYTEEFGVSIGQWRVLAKLGEIDSMVARDMVNQTLMDKSRVSRVVSQLEERGLLKRTRDQQDQRVFFLSLTRQGQALYASIVPRALEWETELLGALDSPEYRDLLRIVEKLERKLDLMGT